MKKFVVILLIACLVLGGIVVYAATKNGGGNSGEPIALYDPENVSAPEAAPEDAAAPETAAEETSADTRTIDYEALCALFEPETVIGSVDGHDVSWAEYSYWLCNMGHQAESYLSMMALYGQNVSWDDKMSSENEQTFAEYVVSLAQNCLRELVSVESVAAENGVAIDESDEDALAAQLAEDIVLYCGEGATEEDFNAYLAENSEDRAMYDRMNRATFLIQKTYDTLYGENGEKVTEEEALAYLADNDYLCASHILFMTIDMNTYESLDEASIALKLAQAEAVSAELRGIEDTEERVKRFAELKELYCEDSGKTAYPEGYLFTAGTMVEEFEDGVNALAEYEVSEPILSPYGYHVIMRLPLSAEMTMEYSDEGLPLSARSICANEQFSVMMNSRIDAAVLTLTDEAAALDLTAFLK